MAMTTVTTYEIIDLVRERAMVKDWELIFDSGPVDRGRVVIWEKSTISRVTEKVAMDELEVHFSPDGRIQRSELRSDGLWHHRNHICDDFGSTDVQIETLRMI